MKRRNAVPAIPPFIDFYGRPTFANPAGQYRPNPALMASAPPAALPVVPASMTQHEARERAAVEAELAAAVAHLEAQAVRMAAAMQDAPVEAIPEADRMVAAMQDAQIEPISEVPFDRAPATPRAQRVAEARTRMHRRVRRTAVAMLAVVGVLGSGVGAYAAFTSHGTGTGSASTATIQSITINVAATSGTSLLPTGSPMGNLAMSVTNNNAFALSVTNVVQNGTISVDAGHSLCTPANAGVTVPTQAVTGVTIPAGPGGQPSLVNIPGVVQMAITSNTNCQGATFTIPVALTLKQP